MILCEVEQTSEDVIGPGNKLADNLTHLTTGKDHVRSTSCPQDFFSEKYQICCVIPLDVYVMPLHHRVSFYVHSFLLLVIATFAL